MHEAGEGVEALVEWMQRCQAAGGSPLLKTKFISEFNTKVIAACMDAGSKVKGGTFENLPPQLVDELRHLHGEARIEAVYNWLKRQGGSVPKPIAVASPY